MRIAGREIGGGNAPYVIAEISGNHCGVLENAKRLIKAAKRAGADAVKTQLYEPDTLTLNISKPDFIVQDGLWRGRTLYDVYSHACTPFAWHKELYKVARDEGITIFSSVFDYRGVDFLNELGAPAYKIASFEIVDTPLIEYAARTGKPLIISTGLASDQEVLDAYEASMGKGAFLHCTSDYPALVSDADLMRMEHLRNVLAGNPVGISDHTLGSEVPVAATALGAALIEKHLKLDTPEMNGKSEDDEFSMTPHAFQMMVSSVHAVWEGLQHKETRKPSRQFRRSLYAVRDIKKGEKFTMENVRSIRPGYGLPPKMLGKILGHPAKRNWKRGEALS